MDALDIVAQRVALQHGRLKPIEPDYIQARTIVDDLVHAGLLIIEGATP